MLVDRLDDVYKAAMWIAAKEILLMAVNPRDDLSSRPVKIPASLFTGRLQGIGEDWRSAVERSSFWQATEPAPVGRIS